MSKNAMGLYEALVESVLARKHVWYFAYDNTIEILTTPEHSFRVRFANFDERAVVYLGEL